MTESRSTVGVAAGRGTPGSRVTQPTPVRNAAWKKLLIGTNRQRICNVVSKRWKIIIRFKDGKYQLPPGQVELLRGTVSVHRCSTRLAALGRPW